MPASSSPPPRRRRLIAGLGLLALIAGLAFAFGEYRAWQLRDSCTGNGGEWDTERTRCTFRGTTPAPPPEPARR